MENISLLSNTRLKSSKDSKNIYQYHKNSNAKEFHNSGLDYPEKSMKSDFKFNLRYTGGHKIKAKKKRTAKSNGQKEFNNVSPMNNFKIVNSKIRAQSSNLKNGIQKSNIKNKSLMMSQKQSREGRIEGKQIYFRFRLWKKIKCEVEGRLRIKLFTLWVFL